LYKDFDVVGDGEEVTVTVIVGDSVGLGDEEGMEFADPLVVEERTEKLPLPSGVLPIEIPLPGSEVY